MDSGSKVIRAAQFFFGCIWVISAEAQINEGETSRDFLALQCAASSGRSAENFREYSQKLALTISRLDATQQKRVFGYVPTPSGPASAGVPQGPDLSSLGEGIGQANQEENPGFFDKLVDSSTRAISDLIIPDSGPEPIIAGTPPVAVQEEGVSTADPPATEIEDGNNGHGNSDGTDPSNPGASEKVPPGQAKKEADGDGNNGHGDSDGFDPSNPGKGVDKSSSKK